MTIDNVMIGKRKLCERGTMTKEKQRIIILVDNIKNNCYEVAEKCVEDYRNDIYNKALEDFSDKLKFMIKEHRIWCESEEEYISHYYIDNLTYSDIEEIVEQLTR